MFPSQDTQQKWRPGSGKEIREQGGILANVPRACQTAYLGGYFSLLSITVSWDGFLAEVPVCRTTPHPQRDLRGLHRLPHRREQFRTQGFQVRLVAQPGGERFERPGRVVL